MQHKAFVEKVDSLGITQRWYREGVPEETSAKMIAERMIDGNLLDLSGRPKGFWSISR